MKPQDTFKLVPGQSLQFGPDGRKHVVKSVGPKWAKIKWENHGWAEVMIEGVDHPIHPYHLEIFEISSEA